MQQDKITRRKFVAGTTGAAFGAMIVPRHVLGGPGYQSPSDRLNIAVVGAGGQGATDAAELVAGGENIVALADVDFVYVDKAVARRTTGRDGKPNQSFIKLQEAYGKAKRHADYRKLLEQHKDIDAVLIATPDHTHAVIAKAAMELGKHVYVEKPMTWSIHEARVLRETAKRTKVVTQMGNQGHSGDGTRLINEWIQAGVIGAVKEVHVWTNRPIWPQGVPRPAKATSMTSSSPTAPGPTVSGVMATGQTGQGLAGQSPGGQVPGGQGPLVPGFIDPQEWTQRRLNREMAAAMTGEYPVPSTLDWNLFLGPAAEVPYHPIYHPFNWRGWVDWGTGALGDMAAHLLDQPYWALGLTYPTIIEATSTPWGTDNKNNPASYPLATRVAYQFPARGAQPPVTLTWYDGGLMPTRPDLLPEDVPLERGGGGFFIGEKGILTYQTYGNKPNLFPASLMEAAQKVPKIHPRIETNDDAQKTPKHRMNWALAVKGQGQASSPFEYAGPLTETMLLGVVAMRTGQGKRIHYDGEAGRITSPSEANQYLQREYRKGWSL